VHASGARDSRAIAVQITDETGRPVDAATVSFRMPEEGPGGLFAGGMRTEVVTTRADGNAVVRGITWNRAPGAFHVRVTAVKGQVRAGTIIAQYISDAPQPKAGPGAPTRRKWIAIAAIVGGGAAAGVVVGLGRSSQSAATAPTAPPPTIGAPTIAIGRP
jgi:hypothetical protein